MTPAMAGCRRRGSASTSSDCRRPSSCNSVLLEFPQQSRLAITNGRALNTFLDLCGKAALNHQQYRKDFERLTQLGHQIGGQRVLRREDIERVQFKKGPRESAMTVDAKRGALTLDCLPSCLPIATAPSTCGSGAS